MYEIFQTESRINKRAKKLKNFASNFADSKRSLKQEFFSQVGKNTYQNYGALFNHALL